MTTYDETDLYSGLAAMHWSAYDEPAWDHDFYRRVVEEAGGLALDVACGAGRLLRRYLQAGLAVEGVDSSADMLAVCQRKAEAEGLAPVLYCQPMQALDLPKRYACIYIPCGSFTCVMGQENALEALRRLHRHLLPGGVLAFNAYWGDWEDFDYNDPAGERLYPTDWKPHVVKELGGPRRLVVERRTMGVDPVEQMVSEQRRYRLYEGDELLAEEVHAGQNHWYFKKELLLMLRLTGFGEVRVTGDYTDEEFGPQHTGTIVFVCRKPVE
jgi:SAM-dependent methyltransferase